MAYDGSSLYGDIVCDDYYDTQNNLMNPPSDVGFFFYKIVGGAFDRMSEICSNFLNDCDVLTCVLVNREYGTNVSDFKSKNADTDYVVTTDYESFDHYKYDKSSDSFVFVETTDNAFLTRTKLDTRWGKAYDLPRPWITDDDENYRQLYDNEYRVYLYMNLCRVLTLQDIRIVSERCFNTENGSVVITEVPSGIFTLTDRLNNNLSLAGVTDYINDDSEVHLTDMLSRNVATFTQINIPAQGWDTQFLALVKEFASLKGNVLIQEVTG